MIGPCLYYIRDEDRYHKTANVFRGSLASISYITRRVSHVVVTFLGPQFVKLPKTEMEVKELANNFLETHSPPQCIRAIGVTHIEIKEPNKHYSDYINRKGYYFIKLQSVCEYRYCFPNVAVKLPGSVGDSSIFLNSSIKIPKIPIPKFEKVLVEGHDAILVCLIGDPAYPLLPFLIKEHPGGANNQRKKIYRPQIIKCHGC